MINKKFYNSYLLVFMLPVFIAAACAGSKKPTLNHGNSSYSQAAPSSRSSGEDSRAGATSGAEKDRVYRKRVKEPERL